MSKVTEFFGFVGVWAVLMTFFMLVIAGPLMAFDTQYYKKKSDKCISEIRSNHHYLRIDTTYKVLGVYCRA